jgi:hypothetical protein
MLPREGEVKYLNQLGEKVKPLVPQFPLAEPAGQLLVTSRFGMDRKQMYYSSNTILIAPLGHTEAQRPHPLQNS